MKRKLKSMDGNTAAAHVAYAFTEVAGIYPITPSSPMADLVDQWAVKGRKNVFGSPVKVVEMESEAGAAGTVHGSLSTGALTTTFTASQGLLLMIPNMYKIAAERLPGVFHVSARTVATHALNIFGDHSDVMACRQTGFAMLAENNVQEVMDLAPVAHLSAIEGGVPFLNFFDGFRTSHEIQKVATWDYDDLAKMVDMDAVRALRARALNPEHPSMRGSHENGDLFFQNREACNKAYMDLPAVVENYMNVINKAIGTNYHLFDYYGDPDADRVVVCMGSFCNVLEEVIDYLNAHGQHVGMVKVRLYRPFVVSKFLEALPAHVKHIAVLDRTKEPGAVGEPLYEDVATALFESGRFGASVIHGRYGLGSKDTPASSAFAVFDELAKDDPKKEFTLGIVDDVTHLSLDENPDAPDTTAEGTIECKFWGIGGDGTVGANKNSIKIIGDHTDKQVQAYFQYDSKKTSGVTISHLRFGDKPIRSSYYVAKADFVACHAPAYIDKHFKIAQGVKPHGTLLINCQWKPEELGQHLSADEKRYIAQNDIHVYMINAIDLAQKIGMGKRTNTVLQSAFFALSHVIPIDDAITYMKEAAKNSYASKGQDIVEMNYKAIDAGATAFERFDVPESWKNPEADPEPAQLTGAPALVKQVVEIQKPTNLMEGDSLPVSAFADHADGRYELGAAAYEKRGIAVTVPSWDPSACIQCNQCSYTCPHAAIRSFLLDDDEAQNAPAETKLIDARGRNLKKPYKFEIAVSPLDCMGCNICVTTCPTHSLTMIPQAQAIEAGEQKSFDYSVAHVSEKPEAIDKSVKGTQFKKPLLEFSGACAGCAQPMYARLVTQMFGGRMFVANATGCSSIWGGPAGNSPFTTDAKGNGPAWSNSLFEDNAEFGFGMALGHDHERAHLIDLGKRILDADDASDDLKSAINGWLDTIDDSDANQKATDDLKAALADACEKESGTWRADADEMLEKDEYLAKKAFWIFGGDGWAYDIGYGGLDHVLASGADVNVFVFDTEVYSNTGGQASKASNIGQVAEFAAGGKSTAKKGLAELAMNYGYVYVAQVAIGAKPAQTARAIAEAEAYHGPSLIVGYAPCEMHSIKGGMQHCSDEMKRAVDCGYWNLFRFNPAAPKGKRFVLDSKEPKGGYRDFLMNEARYSRLTRENPERADELFAKSEKSAMERFNRLEQLKRDYDEA